MKKELKFIVIALCIPLATFAQNENTEQQKTAASIDDAAFTFTEAQIGDDDNTLNTISIVGSNHNVYASEVGYRFSPARFKYRALGGKYNEMYINGAPANDVERGEFNFSFVGGLNNQTRNSDQVLPFESAGFGMSALAGSTNYNFRPGSMPTGQRFGLSGGNRNYTARAMYSYNSGVSKKGWIVSGALTYRWANMETANIEGTFYNALSYYLGVQKIINEKHTISLATWGNPTERAAQSASTDEMYWIANSNYYNPNWGYQDGKKRSSRIVKSYSPSAIFTWDWKIDDKTKLTTSFLGKYQMYSSSSLNYNGGTSPKPDYYSVMPSSYYNVWDPSDSKNIPEALNSWQAAYDYLKGSKANRQINWDALYAYNQGANAQGHDAVYYLQAYHDDQLSFNLSSNLSKQLNDREDIIVGITLSANKGMHYQTMEDLLGANTFRNINTYLVGTYTEDAPEAQYDMNNPGQVIGKGDRFGYDYNIFVNKATLWTGYNVKLLGGSTAFVSGRISGTSIQREGKMRHGLAPNNSYGKGSTAYFVDGGVKGGVSVNLGAGNTVVLGMSYEGKSPTPKNAFYSPQVNNDFVKDLKLERIFGTEVGYLLTAPWLQASFSAYYNIMNNVTEYSMAYSDYDHTFTYMSLTGIQKEYMGLELGLNFKVTDWLNIKALGTLSDAKYRNNADVVYMKSEDGKYYEETCLNEGMREGGTPLTAASLDLNYHNKGWFIDLIGNYYDNIYLYYSPITRYKSKMVDNDGDGIIDNDISQAKGKGGFMLDASIGKSIFLKKGRSLSINLMLTNLLNNTKLCTGGMEQNRSDYDEKGQDLRLYKFANSPKKFYANGINGMLNITYKF